MVIMGLVLIDWFNITVSATDTEIVVEEVKGKGKKMETVQHTISFDDIKTTKIQIKF